MDYLQAFTELHQPFSRSNLDPPVVVGESSHQHTTNNRSIKITSWQRQDKFSWKLEGNQITYFWVILRNISKLLYNFRNETVPIKDVQSTPDKLKSDKWNNWISQTCSRVRILCCTFIYLHISRILDKSNFFFCRPNDSTYLELTVVTVSK